MSHWRLCRTKGNDWRASSKTSSPWHAPTPANIRWRDRTCTSTKPWQCVRSVDSLATQRGLKLNYEPAAHELFFNGDEGLLRRMTLNILDNAIKYTSSGGTVRVSLRRNGSSCKLAIADTGRGIPPELQTRVFERFFRADGARSRNGGPSGSGAGLGLAIASWIAELHGGNLSLEKSDQSGSTFVISLPLAPYPLT